MQSSEEFCIRWVFSDDGFPDRQSFLYKHLCIRCPQHNRGKVFPAASGSSCSINDSVSPHLSLSFPNSSMLEDRH